MTITAYATEKLTNGPVTVTLDSNRKPIVSGFGVGARAQLLGYFVRADWAWGIDNNYILPRIFYLVIQPRFLKFNPIINPGMRSLKSMILRHRDLKSDTRPDRCGRYNRKLLRQTRKLILKYIFIMFIFQLKKLSNFVHINCN